MIRSPLQQLAELKRHLTDIGCEFAVVGGLAVSARSRPRNTKDVDVAVAVPSDMEAEAIVRSLITSGYAVIGKGVVENKATGRMSTVRLHLKDSHDIEQGSDLLFASSGIEREIVKAATPMDLGLPGIVRVAQVGHLIATKVLSEADNRRHDRADLAALLDVATDYDLGLASESLDLITKRGFNRTKDLHARLEEFIAMESNPDPLDGPDPPVSA